MSVVAIANKSMVEGLFLFVYILSIGLHCVQLRVRAIALTSNYGLVLSLSYIFT